VVVRFIGRVVGSAGEADAMGPNRKRALLGRFCFRFFEGSFVRPVFLVVGEKFPQRRAVCATGAVPASGVSLVERRGSGKWILGVVFNHRDKEAQR
jgi:hypothetical protein